MNRLLAVFITAFWITMWGLLLRTELQPQNAALREVPIDHVLKVMFHHQEPSDLFLRADGGRIGQIHFRPQIRPEDGVRILELKGNAQLQLPAAPRQRLNWEGIASLNESMELQQLHVSTNIREATTQRVPETTFDGDFNLVTKVASYQLRTDHRLIDEYTFTLDEAGFRSVIERLGIDPQFLQTLHVQAKGSQPHITAHQSSMLLKGEKVETLLVTLQVNEQTILEAQVSQLGQVLQAKTLTGWTVELD